jgi:hypothetical protein
VGVGRDNPDLSGQLVDGLPQRVVLTTMFDWLNKGFATRKWDARFRIAHYKNDFQAALEIALERLRHGTRKDAEYVLVVQGNTAERAGPQAAPYFRAILEAMRERYPEAEDLRWSASSDLATALGPNEEALSLAENAYHAWDRMGTQIDSEDAWPKQEPRAKMARRRLADLYRKLSRPEDAARVFPLAPCRHLAPLAADLEARGIALRYSVGNDEIYIHVDAILDPESLAQRLGLAPEAIPWNYFDPKSYQDLGFKCSTHLIWLLGDHYEQFAQDSPERLRENWVR